MYTISRTNTLILYEKLQELASANQNGLVIWHSKVTFPLVLLQVRGNQQVDPIPDSIKTNSKYLTIFLETN